MPITTQKVAGEGKDYIVSYQNTQRAHERVLKSFRTVSKPTTQQEIDDSVAIQRIIDEIFGFDNPANKGGLPGSQLYTHGTHYTIAMSSETAQKIELMLGRIFNERDTDKSGNLAILRSKIELIGETTEYIREENRYARDYKREIDSPRAAAQRKVAANIEWTLRG